MGARYISRSSFLPGSVQVARCIIGTATDIARLGYTSDTPEGVVIMGTGLTSDANTTGTFPIFYVPIGTYVTNMVVSKDLASTLATFGYGDSDVDGYWPGTDLLSTATGMKDLKAFVSTAEAGGYPAYINGKVYTTADDHTTDNMCAINGQCTTTSWKQGCQTVYLFYTRVDETHV